MLVFPDFILYIYVIVFPEMVVKHNHGGQSALSRQKHCEALRLRMQASRSSTGIRQATTGFQRFSSLVSQMYDYGDSKSRFGGTSLVLLSCTT